MLATSATLCALLLLELTRGNLSSLASTSSGAKPRPPTTTAYDPEFYRRLDQEDFVSAVLDFIEATNDQARSSGVPCRTRTSLAHFRYNFSSSGYEQFRNLVVAAIKVANILNNLELGGSQSRSLLDNGEVYYNLARATTISDPAIYASGLAFVPGSSPTRRPFAPFAYRTPSGIEIADVAPSFNYSYDSPAMPGADWFWRHLNRNYSRFESVNVSDTVERYVATSPDEGVWSEPYFDCGVGVPGGPTWVISYSAPFFALKDSVIIMK